MLTGSSQKAQEAQCLFNTFTLCDHLECSASLIIQFTKLMQQTWCQRIFLQRGTIYSQALRQYMIFNIPIFKYFELSSTTQFLNYEFFSSLTHHRKLAQRLSIAELQTITALFVRLRYRRGRKLRQ